MQKNEGSFKKGIFRFKKKNQMKLNFNGLKALTLNWTLEAIKNLQIKFIIFHSICSLVLLKTFSLVLRPTSMHHEQWKNMHHDMLRQQIKQLA